MRISKREFKRMLAFMRAYQIEYTGSEWYAIEKLYPKKRAFMMVLGEPGLRSCILQNIEDTSLPTKVIEERIEDERVKPSFDEDDFRWALYSYLKSENK